MEQEVLDRIQSDDTTRLEAVGDMIAFLIRKAWGDAWGLFSDEEPAGEDPTSVSLPRITWDYTREYSEEMKSLKPRLFQTLPDPEQPDQMISEWRQWFDCDMEFQVWARTGREARKLAARFEELLITYAGAFRFVGVDRLIFLRDENTTHDLGRQDVRARKLTYRVRTERSWKTRQFTLQQIQTLIGLPDQGKVEVSIALDPTTSPFLSSLFKPQ